jgi:DNA-binding HxlR family transcriptional regulator
MVQRITDPKTAKTIQTELTELINHSRKFSIELKDILNEYKVDIPTERKATVEALRIILQKWVVEIIHALFIEGDLRFNDLKRHLKGISSRTLTKKLRLLEDAGFVKRNVISDRPTIVEYGLTDKGQTFAELSCPIICYLKLGKA